VPVKVDLMQILSPAANDTVFTLSKPEVLVSEIVVVSDVAEPFFIIVKVLVLPLPGPASRYTDNLSRVIAWLTTCSTSLVLEPEEVYCVGERY
jgi:hypothetical protein